MSFSNVSATQRQQEEEALKKILAIGVLASTILHAVALPLSLKLLKPAEFPDDAIEIVMLDEPKVEEIKPEPAIKEKESPPPETFKPEPPPEPTPPEEPPVAVTPPPIPEEPPVAPPPIPEEPPVAATPPPIPEEAPIAATPPPIPEEAPIAATPPPIPEQPSAIAPKQDLTPPETPPSPIANEPKNDRPIASEQPPQSEPPVTQSRPKGAESAPDFTANAGNPKSSNSPENNNSPSPSAEALNPASEPIARSPAAGPPVTATRPGGSSNSQSAIADLTNPAGNPAQSESEISSAEALNPASGPIARSPAAGPPVTATRPGGSSNSESAIADVTNPAGNPAQSESEISSSEPFETGSGPIARSPAAGPPVTATRPGGSRNSESAIADLTNPTSGPGGGNPQSESGSSSSSSEPFAGGSGPIARSPAAGPPVTATRPGSSRNSGSAIADATNPGGSPSNSVSGGSGTGGGGSSEPFSSGSGSVPKPKNPGGGEISSRPSGPAPGTCISCGKPEYPSAARKEGRQGQVKVKFDIDPNGKAFNIAIEISSKYDDFDRAAIKTVERWKFASSESGIQGKTASITFRLNE